ncbi:MAG: hypothetical protein LBL83_08805 [Clostridiales bacterium]|jgi:hypothetical protein|nr:hypothetical protein [Clostridiales bacterium]
MASYLELDVDSVARIGLIFLDGDSLEDILLDKYGHTDYDFDKFNACKKAIMKIERLNPSLEITAILWQRRPDSASMAVPVVAGRALPLEGHAPSPVSPALEAAFSGRAASAERESGGTSHYYPVKNIDAEIVGALELLRGNSRAVDV